MLLHKPFGQFAVEVAMLSLILADYPNPNGWNISQIDLFDRYCLIERAKAANVVLCNPPFELFTEEERLRYPEVTERSLFKSVAALDGVLDAQPMAIGFVLPEPFITGLQFQRQRRRLEAVYKDIEVVALPDRIFEASVIRSSLLIAHSLRAEGDSVTSLRSTVVATKDRERFLRFGTVTDSRTRCGPQTGFGDLWVEDLADVWEYLAGLRKLGSIVDVHVGIRWRGGPTNSVSAEEKDGFLPGIHEANAVHAFALGKQAFLDARPESVEKRTAALRWPWHLPKLLANAARLSRGPWCFAATADRRGLLASQQLFGIWPKDGSAGTSLEALCALLNSPIAVAYLASHSPPDRIRVRTVKAVPIPAKMPIGLEDMVQEYTEIAEKSAGLFANTMAERASETLNRIDAAILAAYNLPPRLERRLLEYFRADERPTVHPWQHWYPEDFTAFLPLHRYLSAEFKVATSGWVLDVFKPLPKDEASALREYLD
jgi:hypothetical protein